MEAVNARRAAQQWFTLDRDWVIASCGDDVPGVIGASVGCTLWDAFPGCEPHFRGVYEAGWKNGASSAIIYWNDDITEVHTVRRDSTLLVSFEYLTVSGLRTTLETIAGQLAIDHRSTSPATVKPQGRIAHLRVVPR